MLLNARNLNGENILSLLPKDNHAKFLDIGCSDKEIFKCHGFGNIIIKGAGYHPLPSIIGNIDVRHSEFSALFKVFCFFSLFYVKI